MCNQPTITFVGEPCVQGVYLLRLHVAAAIAVSFGRFQGGRSIPIPPGDYLYIGSALGQRGATTLAGRLLRHTTRSGSLPPHAIQSVLRARLQERALLMPARIGLPHSKRPFWHIDYLVDRLEVEITHLVILHTTNRLESLVAHTLAADPVVTAVAPGLGASDDPNATHLYRVDATAKWWHNLAEWLANLLTKTNKGSDYATGARHGSEIER